MVGLTRIKEQLEGLKETSVALHAAIQEVADNIIALQSLIEGSSEAPSRKPRKVRKSKKARRKSKRGKRKGKKARKNRKFKTDPARLEYARKWRAAKKREGR